jgi:rod shape determining protein RodA
MLRKLFAHLYRLDWSLLFASLGLMAFGLVAMYTTSLANPATPELPIFDGQFALFWKQVCFAAAGVMVMVAVSWFNHGALRRYAMVCYVLATVLLVAVLLFGKTIRGTTGWFAVGGFGVQPVELVKLLLAIAVARWCERYARGEQSRRLLLVSGTAVAMVCGLVLLEPDLGSAFLLAMIWGGQLVASNAKRWQLGVIVLGMIAVAAASWTLVLKPYQRDRVLVFLNPTADRLGSGYNVTQSLIAVGSGGMFGRGLGYGSQSQLRFLPERQTDFIFAVIGEELGFVGVGVLVGLFAIIVSRAYQLASHAEDDFTVYLAVGIAVSFASEAAINVGGAMRLLPLTGVTLPLVSYGGSSLLAKCLMLGVLQSIAVGQNASRRM